MPRQAAAGRDRIEGWEAVSLGRKYVKQLTIGGFQVFADPVTIPLGPLTLVYGPNSAGKSAILDAMLALADLCECRAPKEGLNKSTDHAV